MENIFNIFGKYSDEEIVNMYTKRELTDMYYCIYDSTPRSACNKRDIVDIIRGFMYTLRRAEAFRYTHYEE